MSAQFTAEFLTVMLTLQSNAQILGTERKTKYFHILEQKKVYHINLNDKLKVIFELHIYRRSWGKENMLFAFCFCF